MRAILPYLILFFGSLLLVAAIVAGLVMFAPGFLGTAAEVARADSVRVDPGHLYGPTVEDLRGGDSLFAARSEAAHLRDSIRVLAVALAAEQSRVESLRAVRGTAMPEPGGGPVHLPADSVRQTGQARSVERKSMAKMLESMQPENAARVLRSLPDEDVKNLLLNVKRKQAAKILGALEPDRVAKLMR